MITFVDKQEMHKMQPQITVILPFFNVGLEFDRAIQSIVNQTCKHWEMLLVSNNGNDKGLEIARKWTEKDSRIKLQEETRQGIAFALNTGLKRCQTPYVARMDADDISHADRFEKQLDYLKKNPTIDVVSTQTIFSSDIPGSKGFNIFVDWQNAIISPEQHDLFRFIESPLAHPTIMFKRELIGSFGLYSTHPVPEDYEMWLRWMDQGVRFYKIPEPLLTWSDHSGRLTRTHENYSREAFFRVKCAYLAKWIKRNIGSKKKVIVCGSSRIGRKRAHMLQEHGVDVYGFTDVKKRPNRQVRFIRIPDITNPETVFLVNFIARRGVGPAIRTHFSALGFKEGKDFIMGA